jgi:hypothetical protein
MAFALALAVVGFATLPRAASASPDAPRILVVFSDGAHTEQTIRSQLAAVPGVAAVDTFDASTATPDTRTLQNYDVVVTYSSTDYADPAALGDHLSDYATLGGEVVELAFDWSARTQRHLGGRWASEGLSPYNLATTVLSTTAALGTNDATSPLLAGVHELGTDARQDVTLAPGAVELARWSDGQSAVAFKGRAVAVNACVADGCDAATGDIARLIVNAAGVSAVGQLLRPDKACQADTFFQQRAAAGNPYTAARDGVITSWYLQSADPVASGLKLKVGRFAPAGGIQIVASLPVGPQTADRVNGPYPARVPVQRSDLLGLFADGGFGLCAASTASSSDVFGFTAGDIAVGTVAGFPPGSGLRFPVEAVVEADVDGDGFGDLTQDRCVGVAGSDGGCRPSTLPPAAVISHVRQSHRSWREPSHRKLAHASRRRAPVGTTFRFDLDRPAPVQLVFTRRGHKSAVGTLRVNGHRGTDAVRFFGSLTRRKRLRPGRYAVAFSVPARATKPHLAFTIVR